MNNVKLIEFLKSRINQLKTLDALSDAVMQAKTISEGGEKYRTLIEKTKEAWQATDKLERQNNKIIKKNPAARKDSRVGWFNSIRSALHQASSHSRPAVNSRNLGKIHDAAYQIHTDLSFVLFGLEKALAEIDAI